MVYFVRWLRRRETALLLILAAFLAISLATNVSYLLAPYSKSDRIEDYANTTERECKTINEAMFEKEDSSESATAERRNKQKKEDYSLCLSIQSAKYARSQAVFAEGQFWANIASAAISFFAFIAAFAAAAFAAGTVGQSRRAVDEAKRQANAAWEAVEHARVAAAASVEAANIAAQEARRRYKPWLVVDLKGPFVLRPGPNDELRAFSPGERLCSDTM